MHALRLMLLPGLALALLAGCSMSGRPDNGGQVPPPAAATSPAVAAPAAPTSYVVAPGDTVYGLARRFGVDRRELIRVNNLAPPYKLLIGQRLILPAPATQSAVASPPAAPTILPPPAPPAAGEPTPPAVPRPSVTAVPLAPPPGMAAKPPAQPAVAPASVASAAPPPAAASAPPPAPPAPSAGAGAPPPLDKAAPPSPPESPAAAAPAATDQAAAAKPGAPEPKTATTANFLWPVNGKVIARFGSIANGLHNDGINIAVPVGTPVHAADAGVVAYAGNELKGFGNLLLIRHANGWMSAYAHNDALLVKRGDTVKRGQVIAKAGATGNVTSPQLHFELRHNTEAVDPQAYLGSS
jgi:murein DD-endopeptidase MepM/ murein hydrolase activator NlpD